MEIIRRSEFRMEVMKQVSTLRLPDTWVAAGFVRNAVWDHLHGFTSETSLNDVDVIYFDRKVVDRHRDEEAEEQLSNSFPGVVFSVKNQARMHIRNRDEPYRSATDAMTHWPETCTAIGVAREGDEILYEAPFGLSDLFSLTVRPTSSNASMKSLVKKRSIEKGWMEIWPNLILET